MPGSIRCALSPVPPYGRVIQMPPIRGPDLSNELKSLVSEGLGPFAASTEPSIEPEEDKDRDDRRACFRIV